ncbi:67_t:CDS:1, partial [Racocetra persica]
MGIWLDGIRKIEFTFDKRYKQLRTQPRLVHLKKLHNHQTGTLDFINE